MKRNTVGFTVLVVLTATFSFNTYKSGAQREDDPRVAAQSQERVIVKKGDTKSPVKIINICANGRAIVSNTKFFDDDDWLKGLAVKVANPTSKTVTFVEVILIFRRPENNKQPPAAWTLKYGANPFRYKTAEDMPSPGVKPALPGDYIELKLSDIEYDALKHFLQDTMSAITNKVEIRVTIVGFSDGTAWTGQMMQRNLKEGWIPLALPDGAKMK